MDPRSPQPPPSPPRLSPRPTVPPRRAAPPRARLETPPRRRRLHLDRLGLGGDGGRADVRAGPWRTPRRLLPLALLPILLYLSLWTLVGYSLGAAGCRGERPAVPLLAARPDAPPRQAGSPRGTRPQGPGAAAEAAEVLVESATFALPPSTAANRFDTGWDRRRLAGGEGLVATSGSGRLQAVNLGEEVPRTLTLDLAREELPEGARLRVRSGDRELARATLRSAALPLAVRLPEDLPVGPVALDLLFEPGPRAALGSGTRPALPVLHGAGLTPALPAGSARIEGSDVVMAGNCLVYLSCRLAGNEALVGTFVPPAGARPGQRFDLSVERLDAIPIRRFGWQPSFWNRLRGARRFELPLRGTRGPVRVRLISRAGPAGGPPGRWQALGLVNVTGEILTPGQGQ
jgi:hypothetical protein